MQQKAREEVISVLGGNGDNVLPDSDQLAKLEYLSMLMKEV